MAFSERLLVIVFPCIDVLCRPVSDRVWFTACELASWVWERRDRFKQNNFTPEQGVAAAMDTNEGAGPVVMHEISDNPGSGAPGDATHLLRSIIEQAISLPPHSACFGAS